MKTQCRLVAQVRGMCCFPLVLFLWMPNLTQGKAAIAHTHGFMSAHELDTEDMHYKVNASRMVVDPAPEDHEQPEPKGNKNKGIKIWSGVSIVPPSWTYVIGFVWVCLLGSGPLFVFGIDKNSFTRTGIVLSTLLWLALFGGLFLFTTVIMFQSSHFDQVRSLTMIECCYFMTQVITTVGYGDITPAMPRGQLFVGMYVLVAFFVIAMLVSELQSVVMNRVSKYKDVLEKHTGLGAKIHHHTGLTHTSSCSKNLVSFKPEKPSPAALLISISVFFLIAAIWVLFFHYFPGEEKAWIDCIYMALITLTTVGFGAITPDSEGGMLFGAFFMFFGTSALVNVVSNFTEYIMEVNQWEQWKPEHFREDLKKLRETVKGKKGISEIDFLKFTLVQKSLISEEQLAAITDCFHELDFKHRGAVDFTSLAKFNGVAAQDLSPRLNSARSGSASENWSGSPPGSSRRASVESKQ